MLLGDSSRISAGNYSLFSRLARGLNLDLPLLIGLLVLCGLGLVVLYSAGGESVDLLLRQSMRLGLALLAMVLVAHISPHALRLWTPWLYGVSVLLLLIVAFTGDVGKGAQRWLDLGIIRFQPSEMMKLAMPMMVAWYLHEKSLPPRLPHLLALVALLAVPVILIAEQPDLGTALLVASAGAFAVYLSGLRWRTISLIIGLLAVALWPLYHYVLHDYQQQRVLTFLNPERDPLGSGYHIIQSSIAIGSGGLFGKGWLNGTQSQLDFLPERHTDFIFAVLAEEFGLLGVLVVLAVYAFIIARSLHIALSAEKTFSRLLAGSLALTFFVYVFVNIGMVSGLLPVVGVPLPLISYGGTSMVTLLTGFGMLMSIHAHRKLMAK